MSQIRRLGLFLALLIAGITAADTEQRERERELRRTPVVEVFERSRDAVVNISSTQIVTVRTRTGFDDIFDMFDMPSLLGPRTRDVKRQSVGSGFVIHPEGYIVTNAHVVNRTLDRKVTFADGREYDATIIASDAQRDLAILKVDADGSLPILDLGRSDDLMVGETVIAIGNPLGYQHTVTSGVVSAVGRDLSFPNQIVLENLIQTDASINPGNSGGPLLNALGQLIGVNTAIRGDAQNIGFAIPVDQLREILPELLDLERRYRIVIGATIDTLREPRILRVQEDSPAARTGLQPCDLLLALDGRTIREGVEFYIAMIGRRPGERLRLTVERDGALVHVALELGERPRPDGRRLAQERFGLHLEPLPPEHAHRLRLPPDAGLLVAGVERQSPAGQLGIERGDILIALDRRHISDIEELGQILEMVGPGDGVSVTIFRADRRGSVQLTGRIRAR